MSIKPVDNLKRSKNDKFFMDIAQMIARASKCTRSQVGTIIVRQGVIIATGYNYVVDPCEVCFREKSEAGKWSSADKCPVIHAEILTIARAAKNGIELRNSTMYNTYIPCMQCARAILHSGIKRVVYKDTYPNCEEVVNFMVQEGITVHDINGGDPYKDISKDTPLQVDS